MITIKKYITTIIKNTFLKEIPVAPMGRWRIEQCSTQMNSKIDLSNEDHCGPCGQYALKKIEHNKSDQTKDDKKNK